MKPFLESGFAKPLPAKQGAKKTPNIKRESG